MDDSSDSGLRTPDTQNIVIIKYNAGNIRSVTNALVRLGYEAEVTADPKKIKEADKVIFPGVGEASTTMAFLRNTGLDEVIINLKQPVLGICLGMQLMCSFSEEGSVDCLGIFDEQVKKFQLPETNLQNIKIPHMGWNKITNVKAPLFDSSLEGEYVYFVHSYYVAMGEHTVTTTNYIHPYSSSLQRDNFYATQFHPEKSGEVGERILANFLKL
ncbi:imidazole glycerol phosphate synthase subunit HisH [Carboxylicivirga marina]|uniref:Imidazole glycerol phosphate synthase subunit HisH n=1 Tax=Carboxylicivirga marina TaxID=2800988 RepID=A0ABS1HKT7_9BACT|nr:imidazole glycerol phosphate synthase subunit HisH [Carboxylicivirga marina]MBK3517888.1 imidazole glycerol phosphate synthase subunit HisH [Carboxylicivirga marina]